MSAALPRSYQLLQAVRLNDLAAVQQQLAAAADPSAVFSPYLPPLHTAAEAGQGPIVAALLAAGADASATPPGFLGEGFTPLLWMVHRVSSAQHSTGFAMDAEIWPSVEQSEGGHTLRVHQCRECCSSRAEVVQHLVAAGAQVDAVSPPAQYHHTPLYFAAQAGCPTLVAALLQAGADPGYTTPTGYTLLHAAATSASREVVQQVLGALGSSRVAELLCSGGAGYKRTTPLHLAAIRGCLEVAEALVAAGADREQQDAEGCTPLHVALTSPGYCHLVPLLVTPGNVNVLYGTSDIGPLAGSTPLHEAVTCPHRRYAELPLDAMQLQVAATLQAVAALLAAGADLSAKDSAKDRGGYTPLALAATKGHSEVLQVLLRHVLQQHKAKQQAQQQPQQPQQQQQQSHGQHMLLLQEAGAMALAKCSDTWQVFLLLVLETLGEEGMHSWWAGVKQQLRQLEQLEQGVEEEPGGFFGRCRIFKEYTPVLVLGQVVECWAAACKQLATQRQQVTGPLEQLVAHYYQQQQQQQQQDGGCGTSRVGKRPRLARELRMLLSESTPAAASAAGPVILYTVARIRSDSKLSRAARAKARHLVAEANQMKRLEAAAARGDEREVHAVLGVLPDRAAGLSAAAGAAGGARNWRLFRGLLWELLQLQQQQQQQQQQRSNSSSSCLPPRGLQPS